MIIKPEIAWGVITVFVALFLALFFSMQIGIFVLLFAIIAWYVWEYPKEGFLTLIILSPLLPLLKATQTLGNATLIKDVIIITLFLKTFFVPLLEQRLPYRKNYLFAPIIALVGWALFEAVRGGSTLAVLRLREIFLYILLYFGVLYLPHTKAIMKQRFNWFIATLIVVMALGVFQFWFAPDSTVLRFDPARMIWIPRMASTFGHPTVFAEYLITGAMLLLAVILNGVRPASTAGKDPRRRIGAVILLFATIILLYFTYTRAAWIGFAVGAFVVGITWLMGDRAYRINKKIIGTGIAAMIIVLFLALRFTPIGTFLRTTIDPNYASNADRINFVVQLISQTSNTDAIIGKGLGNVITQIRKGGDVSAIDIASGDSRTVQLSKDQTLVDNQYLKTFMEMGVVGLVFTFWLFWRFFLAVKAASPVLKIAGIGFLASFMVQALFVDIWDVFPTNAIFWTLAALISAHSGSVIQKN